VIKGQGQRSRSYSKKACGRSINQQPKAK